jgi:hypothetical protein
MIDIYAQVKGLCLIPVGDENIEAIANTYYNNQPVRCKITAAGKEIQASQEQNNLLHACFEVVADGSQNPHHCDKKAVKFACKAGIDFRIPNRIAVTPGGKVVAEYDSFAFNRLKGRRRLLIMDKAFLWCAEQVDMTVEELVAEAKSRMLKTK